MMAFEGNLLESAFLSEKAIHQLRVTIKRLRTLMKLLRAYAPYPETFQYQFKKITSIFKILGTIRDNRNKAKLINYHFSNEEELKEELLLELDESWESAKSSYFEKFHEYSFEYFYQFKIHFDDHLKNNLRSIDTKVVIGDKIDEISNLLEQDGLRENLHKIRAINKELLFLLQIFKLKQLKLNGYKIITKELASLSEYIGQWHDYELLINLYRTANDQLDEQSSIDYESILQKSNELYDFVSDKLQVQFSIAEIHE